MENIYLFKWFFCYEMNKEIINGSISVGLRVLLGEINRISLERVKREKGRGKSYL